MDLEDKCLTDFAQEDLNEIWGTDYVEALRTASDFELSCLLDSVHSSSSVVLNDRLMTEASLGLLSQDVTSKKPAAAPSSLAYPIKTEHSYSLCSEPTAPQPEDMSDIERECFPAVSITEAEGSRVSSQMTGEEFVNSQMEIDCLSTSDTMSCCDESELAGDFNFDDVVQHGAHPTDYDVTAGAQTCPTSEPRRIFSFATRAPTECCFKTNSETNIQSITCQSKSTNCIMLPKSTAEPCQREKEVSAYSSCPPNFCSNDQVISFPPTPPSSFGSDSESGCSSPSRTPLYEALSPQFCGPTRRQFSKHSSSRTPISTPLISTQPKGAIGDLHLTDEEKRTLLSEGYPVPSRLPLTKTEEKSLKKIRRKIKNKISAQESRRKKKEYMDTLEGKVEDLEKHNHDCKKRIEILQNKNSTLLQELHRLQAIVAPDEGKTKHPKRIGF